jgi:myo-inositol-1(or 4)-monophosphatase
MAEAELHELAALAERFARRAGDAVAEQRRAGPLEARSKSTPTDMVTELDRMSEALIVAGLREERPGDAIVGEEGTEHLGTTDISWLIDPVDGTTNLLYGLPGWAVSIAVMRRGETVAGVVHVPTHGELFSATAGGGARCNGATIRCSSTPDLATALVGTGFSYAASQRAEQAVVVAALLPRIRDIRRAGAAAVDLCHAGAGRLDVYFEAGLAPWDMAAGELIAREAGAITSDFTGGPPTAGSIVVAPPQLHEAFLGFLNDVRTAR